MRWRVRVASRREATCHQTSLRLCGVAHSHLKSVLKSLQGRGEPVQRTGSTFRKISSLKLVV